MAMRDDFCVFILTHGRPDNVITYGEIRKSGYTGRIYLVLDDEDETATQYRQRYGAEVLTFSKLAEQQTTDAGDNSGDQRTPLYARNACFRLAHEVGARYFVQLDDDYFAWQIRYDAHGDWCCYRIRTTLDEVFSAVLDFYIQTPALSVALSQGGDHMGGDRGHVGLRRKAMNSFFCSVDRPFKFMGRFNDDVNTYTLLTRQGGLFFTVMQAQLVQRTTQAQKGGITEAYLDAGTYVKSAFTLLYCPSSAKIGLLGDSGAGGPRQAQERRADAVAHYRIHHQINWAKTAPKILAETHRKSGKA